MNNSYSSLCDGFTLEMHVNTELDLPSERETVLSFFERIQKQFPAMDNFYRKSNGDFCLEEVRNGEKYRWVTLELDRIWAGCSEPEDLEDGYFLQQAVLDLAPYMLGVSKLDICSMDISYTMDFDYQGNQDEVIAEAIMAGSAFNSMLDIDGSKAIGFSPTAVIALSEDSRTQARIAVESRTSFQDFRSPKFKSDEPISLYFTVRRYPVRRDNFDAKKSFVQQCKIAEDLMAEKIIPNFAQPLTSAIAQRR